MTIKSFYISLDSYPSQDLTSTMFAAVLRMMENHPDYTRIATYKGAGGTGMFANRKAPLASGENAWAVYRAVNTDQGVPQFDVVFTWSTNFNANQDGHGQWSNFFSEFGSGFCMAMAHHPSGSAWGGSTGGVGNDYFITGTNINEPWRSGSYIFPRANGPGFFGEFTHNAVSTNIQGNPVAASPGSISVFAGTATNNGIIMGYGGVGALPLLNFVYAGGYSPNTSSITVPLCMLSYGSMLNINGGIAGYPGQGVLNGEIISPYDASGGYPSFSSQYDSYFNGEDRNIIAEHSAIVGSLENGIGQILGTIDAFNVVSPNSNYLTFYNNNTRLLLGYGPGFNCYSIPFDPNTILESWT